jgi:membrane associated rhomboid family serine protease
MYPIGDDNQEITRTEYVTWTMIGLNVLVFIYEMMLGDGVDRFVTNFGLIPSEVLNGEDLHTVLTSMFIHGGFAHIIGNMLFLKVFGDNVEDRMGHGRFLLFYLVTGVAASAAHALLNPGSTIPSVGASGAISGVLGAYIVMFRSNRVRVFFGYGIMDVPAWAMIGFWALQQFLNTFASITTTEQTDGGGVAYAAHAGGFVAGVLLALILGGGRKPVANR